MADIFVWSGATGANDGTSWGDAYTSLMRDYGAEAGFTPGTDFVYVRSIHSESQATNVTLTGSTPNSTSDPVRIVSCTGAATGTDPGSYSAGAQVQTTSGGDIYLYEKLRIFGVKFLSNDNIFINGSAGQDIEIHDGRLELQTNSSIDLIDIGYSSNAVNRVVLINTDLDFANVGQGFKIQHGLLIWGGGTLEYDVTNLFETMDLRTSIVRVRNVDLSICSQNLVNFDMLGSHDIRFQRCIVHASVSFVSGAIDSEGAVVEAHHCQSGTDSDPAYQMYRRTYNGTTESDTARYRTDGASDGERTNPYSWSMDTSTGSNVIELYEPLESPPITGWTDGDGSTSHTYRIYVASGATLQDDEVWVELVGPNDAATDSLGVLKTTRPDPLATPANLTTDSSSTWNGTDVTTKQQIDITYTPDKPGPITARIYLAKPSERVSVDPKIYIDPS